MNDSKISLATILGAICIVAIIVFIFMPIYSTPTHSVRSNCVSNTKQMAIANIMYAADNDDRFVSGSDWMDQTYPCTKNEAILHCTALERSNKNIYGYAMNMDILGVKSTALANPSAKVLLFDSVILDRNAVSNLVGFPDPPRHQKNIAAFADGHAKGEDSLAKYR